MNRTLIKATGPYHTIGSLYYVLKKIANLNKLKNKIKLKDNKNH